MWPSGRLAIGKPFDVLHRHDQRQAPGGDFHGAALRGIEIRQELIVRERAVLLAQVDREVAFGRSGPHSARFCVPQTSRSRRLAPYVGTSMLGLSSHFYDNNEFL
jgi:hypothetical protein